jgi:hypothetical protein
MQDILVLLLGTAMSLHSMGYMSIEAIKLVWPNGKATPL